MTERKATIAGAVKGWSVKVGETLVIGGVAVEVIGADRGVARFRLTTPLGVEVSRLASSDNSAKMKDDIQPPKTV